MLHQSVFKEEKPMKTDIETKYEYIKQYEQGQLSKQELCEALKLSRQQIYRLLNGMKNKELQDYIIKVEINRQIIEQKHQKKLKY